MNIQIFGTKKCNDTKKAERFFKERRIKFQFIDLKEKALSKGELQSVKKALSLESLINKKVKTRKNRKNAKKDDNVSQLLYSVSCKVWRF